MTDRLQQGEQLGDYEIVSVAGVGGMGVVYKASQRSLGRLVGLKVIRSDIASSPEYRERFLREARLAAAVDHPHVVTVYDVGDHAGELYIAMQWVEGEDLKKLLARSGRLAPERAVTIATQLAGALDALHGVAGLVHRDVKPANVLLRQVEDRDHAYLTDFGVAKPSEPGDGDGLTQTGWLVGTTGYLAPEQIKGEQPGPRSDLYALACLFFEALTGHPPFEGANEMAVRWSHANGPRPRASALLPALGERYDGFLATALAVEPEERFGSGRQFAEGLGEAHRGSGVSATEADTAEVSHAATAIGPPTPISPRPPAPPPGAMYPTYAYMVPAPQGITQQRQSRAPWALVALGVMAIVGIAVAALAAGGFFSRGSPTRTVASTSPASTQRSGHPQVKDGASQASGGVKSCGGDLSVGPATSCPFAHNVERAYLQSSGGETDVSAYSPATGTTYTMHCTAGTPHACTGGKGASVYFASGPPGSPSPSTPSARANDTGLHACDPNISAGGTTSCPFAENLFVAYWKVYKRSGVQPETSVSAYSPSTHESYPMVCTTEGVTVNCSGGNEAFVTFPMHAVEVY